MNPDLSAIIRTSYCREQPKQGMRWSANRIFYSNAKPSLHPAEEGGLSLFAHY
jgi:hypothetical protein